MDEKGIIFDIQRFSVHDGPGIRTTVFLKGCPLRCAWCHNPEGYKKTKEILYRPNLCIGCGECSVCPESAHSIDNGVHRFDHALCLGRDNADACGLCASVCPSEALRIAGREVTVADVMNTVRADSSYYGSNGGITISGGEPFFQPEFTLALLKEAKSQNINTAVETCGYTSESIFEEALPYIDNLLFDIKLISEEEHIQYTGVSNKTILKNLSTASAQKANLILRCPIIPSVNNRREHIRGIADIANALPAVKEIHLEPYHSMGASKNTQLGRNTDFAVAPPSDDEMTALRASLAELVRVDVKIMK